MSRTGLVALVASVSVAVGVAPAFASTKAEKKQNSAIKKIASSNRKQAAAISKINSAAGSVSAAITALSGRTAAAQTSADGARSTADSANSKADAILAQAPLILDGLTKLKDGLTAAGAGLTAIQTALQDPVTGLVGLNNARPKFMVVSAGAFAGGTPGLTAASVTRVSAGLYVLDFGQDVSKRAAQISLNSPATAVLGPGSGGASPIGQILNCGDPAAATPPASVAACNAVGGAGTASVNKAIVTTENAEGHVPTDFTFTATEIAG